MESSSGYASGAFTFEDPLCEDEDEDINLSVEHSILNSNSSEMSSVDKDEQHTGSVEDSIRNSDESTRISNTSTRRRLWRKISSSLIVVKKFKHFIITSWKSSTSGWDSNSQTGQICDVCDELISLDWLTRPYWGQRVCYKHLSEGSPMCCSCLRFQLGNMRYINLSDGRKLCPDCHFTAIMDTETCIPLFHEVYRFFEGLNMKIIEDIPIFLVDNYELNKFRHETENKDPHKYLLGVATFRAEVVQSVARSSQIGQNIHVVKEVQYIQHIYEVTSILILYGYPRLAIGATLAHEMMHAWMRVEGYKGLRQEVEEGICEVMAHRWLDWHAFMGDDFLCTNTPEQAQFLRNLKELLKNNIERNYCKTYGGGFRDAKWAVERYGLKYTMIHIAQTGKFPQ